MKNLKKKYILFLLIFFFSKDVFSQVGRGLYRFLELPVSSRLAGLGGKNVSIKDNDLNFVFNNPAVLSENMGGIIGLNFANYLADIKYGSAIYSHNITDKNLLSFGIQYVDYAKFKGYDKYDQYTGDFTAKDMALYLSYARPLTENITVGATLKPIVSVLERYTSVGLVSDIGVNYQNELFSAGLVVKNLGVQLKGYYAEEDNIQHREPLPFDIQLGVSNKLKHAPLRLSLTVDNLHLWNVVGYQSTSSEQLELDGTVKSKDIGFLDMALRHTTLGVELLPADNFYVVFGYNHRRHQEMKVDGYKSLAGFSFGAGVKLYKFQVGFGMLQYQTKNYAYHFSISTNINDFISF